MVLARNSSNEQVVAANQRPAERQCLLLLMRLCWTEIRRIFCDAFDDVNDDVQKWLQQHVVCQIEMLNILQFCFRTRPLCVEMKKHKETEIVWQHGAA